MEACLRSSLALGSSPLPTAGAAVPRDPLPLHSPKAVGRGSLGSVRLHASFSERLRGPSTCGPGRGPDAPPELRSRGQGAPLSSEGLSPPFGWQRVPATSEDVRSRGWGQPAPPTARRPRPGPVFPPPVPEPPPTPAAPTARSPSWPLGLHPSLTGSRPGDPEVRDEPSLTGAEPAEVSGCRVGGSCVA